MRVPTPKRQVQENPTLINAPKISGPVPGAFGEQVGGAVTNLGEGISSVMSRASTIIVRRNQELQKEKAAEEFTKMSQEADNLLFSPDTEEMQDGKGGTMSKIVGVMNREGNAAHESYSDFGQKLEIAERGRVDNMDEGTRAEFNKLWTPHKQSLHTNVLRHEVAQRNIAVKQNFLQFKDTTLQNIPLQDEATRLTSIKNVNDRINELEKIGRLTYEEAQKQREDVDTQLFYGSVNANPQGTIDELAKAEGGIYQNLDPKKRDQFIGEAEEVKKKQIAINTQLRSEAINANENKLLDMKIQGKLNPAIVRQWRASDQITAPFADHLITALQSAKAATAVTKSATFEKLAKRILTQADEKGKAITPERMRQDMLIMNGAGEIDDPDMKILQTFNSKILDKDVDKAMPAKKFMEALTFWSDENKIMRPEIRARMFKSYMQKVNANEDPAKAADEVMRQEVLRAHPQAAGYPKEGKLVRDVRGVMKLITPLGAILDFVEKATRSGDSETK